MTKKSSMNIGLMLISIICFAYVMLTTVIPYLVFPQELEIDVDWWIVHNHNDQSDIISAQALQNEYGSLMVWIETAEDENLNTEDQNLLFIGGSETFAGKVPWMETWPALTVLEPSGQPDVYVSVETWDNIFVHTPYQDYYMVREGEFQNDYGVVTKAYDSVLNRYIIIVVGHSAECTYTGAKLLIEDFELVKQKSWIVYELTDKGATDPSTWTLNQFDYEIVASG